MHGRLPAPVAALLTTRPTRVLVVLSFSMIRLFCMLVSWLQTILQNKESSP